MCKRLTRKQREAVERVRVAAKCSTFHTGSLLNAHDKYDLGPHANPLSTEQLKAVNSIIASRFKGWAEAWIEPALRTIEGSGE